MPTVANESLILTALVKHEYAATRGYTRKAVNYKSASAGTLKFGTVLGKRTVALANTVTASPDNIGNGTMGTVTFASGSPTGTYVVRITATEGDAGDFEVLNPRGEVIGTGKVAVAFNTGGVSFTLADGSTDFEVGDSFAIVVTGGVEYDTAKMTAVDGTATPAAIYIGQIDGTFGADLGVEANTAVKVIALVRGPAKVGSDALVLDASFDTEAEKQIVYDALEDLGIAVDDMV